MKAVLATVVLSTLSALSFADATQFAIPPGTLSRAEVIAAIGTPSPASFLGDVTVFAEPTTSSLTRAQVLAEYSAYRAARHTHGESNELRFATDDIGSHGLSRAEVMAEASALHGGQKFGDANRDDINRRSN